MARRQHIVSQMYGPNVAGQSHGEPEPDRLYTPYQEIFLDPTTGNVYFRRNAMQADGYVNNLPWPGAITTPIAYY